AAARVEQLVESSAPQGVDRVSGQLGGGLVGVDHPTFVVDAQDGVGEEVDVDHHAVRRCRAASKQSTAAAIPTFNDSVRPAIGIVTVPSSTPSSSDGRPWASLPSTNAMGEVRSARS